MAEPTNEQLAEAARLEIDVDGRWSAETLAKIIERAAENAKREDEAEAALLNSMTSDEISALEAQMTSAGEAEKKGVKTVPVFLDYDTWIDDVRIRADRENAQDLPLDRAKELLAAGKARRADPLPGDE